MGGSTLAQRCTAEFVGTFMLVFTVGCNVLGGSAIWGGVSTASVLMVCIYTLGGISGANFNPAVTVTLGLSQAIGGHGLDASTVSIYCGIQVLAGVVAGFAYGAMFGETFELAPAEGFDLVSAAVCEMIYTCMLCFVVMNVAVAKKNFHECGQYFGLAIGYVIIAGAYGAGAISGGCFNPALAVAIDVSSWRPGISIILTYVLSELMGAVLAMALFYVIRPEDFGRSYSEVPVLVSEFLGTYLLVLTVGLNVLAGSPAGPFSIAAALMTMIYAIGDVSGAHFNPAVTCALLLSGRDKKLDVQEAVKYVSVQLAGGLAAAFSYSSIYNSSFPLGAKGEYGWMEVAVAEIVFTFVLCYVVLSMAVGRNPAATDFAGLAIGSCVTVGGLAIGGISGGSLNPAVSLGIGATSDTIVNAMIYSALELVGAVLAVGVFRFTHAHTERLIV